LHQGLRSPDAFVLRRCQILLASDRGQRPAQIAATLGCSSQAVRNALHAFAAQGIACLRSKSTRPKTLHTVWPRERDQDLRALLHQAPRTFGKPTSLWTLELAAEVSFAQGLTATRVTGEPIRATLQRLGIGWKRAKHWITSPDPGYARKQGGVTA